MDSLMASRSIASQKLYPFLFTSQGSLEQVYIGVACIDGLRGFWITVALALP